MFPKLYNNQFKRGTNRLVTWNYNWEGMYFITICTSGRQHFFGKIISHEMVLNDFGKIAENEWIKTQEIRKDMNVELFDFVIMPDHIHAIIKIGWNQYNTQIIDPNHSNIPGSCAMHRAATGDNVAQEDHETKEDKLPNNLNNHSNIPGSCAMHRAATGDDASQGDHETKEDDAATEYNVDQGNDITMNQDIFSSVIIPNQLEDLIALKKKSNNKFGPQAKNLASIIRGFKSAVTTQIRMNGKNEFEWQSRFHEHIIRDEKSFKNIQRYIINNPIQWEKQSNKK